MTAKKHPRLGLAFTLLLTALGVHFGRAQMLSPGQSLAPASGCLFGAYMQPGTVGHEQAILNFEHKLGRPLAVDRQYYRWDDDIPTTHEAWTVAQGRVPLISWKPKKRDGTWVRWSKIAAGDEQATITARAQAFLNFPGRVLMAFHHEADIDTVDGNPANFANAFRKIVETFHGVGVTNVQWVMILTYHAYRDGLGDSFYPGDDVIDWIGADGYNWYLAQPNVPWTEFADIFTPFRNWALPHHKPLVIAEWGCQEDPDLAGHKATWIDNATATTKGWPEVKAVSYFNYSDSVYQWRTDSSPSALDAFRRMGADPYFNPATQNACGQQWSQYR